MNLQQFFFFINSKKGQLYHHIYPEQFLVQSSVPECANRFRLSLGKGNYFYSIPFHTTKILVPDNCYMGSNFSSELHSLLRKTQNNKKKTANWSSFRSLPETFPAGFENKSQNWQMKLPIKRGSKQIKRSHRRRPEVKPIRHKVNQPFRSTGN